ncbi:hypothetical protein CDD80_1212 [Ophiocordyceps camponoti-rufipedis]|uniref:Uncharacterized protein n=1 Tax=Ophiocordyceps camponoti-rufipedis TaxID=2004952 RepID=A0A2C5ZAK6_9HYPO|nr:hypothetical protein CDD80_1212 [Ophiocordyceps camponoti-rufipedis]
MTADGRLQVGSKFRSRAIRAGFGPIKGGLAEENGATQFFCEGIADAAAERCRRQGSIREHQRGRRGRPGTEAIVVTSRRARAIVGRLRKGNAMSDMQTPPPPPIVVLCYSQGTHWQRTATASLGGLISSEARHGQDQAGEAWLDGSLVSNICVLQRSRRHMATDEA